MPPKPKSFQPLPTPFSKLNRITGIVGTGVGSVLQLVAWRCLREDPGGDYAGVGVEAQRDSADLARRSVAYNGAPCSVVDGDLRALERPPREGFWAAGGGVLALVSAALRSRGGGAGKDA